MTELDVATGALIAGIILGVLMMWKLGNVGFDKFIMKGNGKSNGNGKKTEVLVNSVEIAKDCSETKGIVCEVRNNQIKTNEITKAGYNSLIKEQKAMTSQMRAINKETKEQSKTLIEIRDALVDNLKEEGKAEKALRRLKNG